MCGIWGYIRKTCQETDIINTTVLFNSFNKIKHRGPDTSTFKHINLNSITDMYLGFHRLAIMDI